MEAMKWTCFLWLRVCLLKLTSIAYAHHTDCRGGGFCWYTIEFSSDGKVTGQNLGEALASRELIHKFINSILKDHDLNIETANVLIMGFSQGAILGYSVALTYPESVSALVAMSGYLNRQILPEQMEYSRLQHLNILITHGTEDPVIPYDWAKKSAEFLEKNFINHRFYGYRAGHSIDIQAFEEIKKFVTKQLSNF
ncbi:alpha/beta hydrolase [Schleiferia thermophila]|uniref:alpha/beta hydrolase n=1 Tax=Schleiferia thermophila TaxID=884107 RepID=UPI003EEF2EDA